MTAPLERDVLIATNRVPPSGVAMVRRLHEGLSDPVVLATIACPSAGWYWDTSPSGWVDLAELLHVDREIDACLTGQPELLFPALLTVGHGHAGVRRFTALTGMG